MSVAFHIHVAKKAGACYGVNRALDIAYEASERTEPVHTLGPLIHNPQVVSSLEKVGVVVADTLDDARSGCLIIRSHGTTPDLLEEASERGFSILDATCPHVLKAQRCAAEICATGTPLIIVGEDGHPEVEGIRAWAAGDVICVLDDAASLPESLPSHVGVVCQTTQAQATFEAVVSALEERGITVDARDTVCFATKQRQTHAAELARDMDVMLIVGGRNSGNTTRLYEICSSHCAASHHIETAEEIDALWFEGAENVGITAGASTPEDHISRVVDALVALGGETIR